jgi:type IV conjugative transfer system coupling protein TraD
MFGQGSKNSVLVGFFFMLGWLAFRISQKLTIVSVYYFLIERYVQLKLEFGKLFYPISEIGIEFYHLSKKAIVFYSADEFLHRFWNATNHGSYIINFCKWCLHSALFELSVAFCLGLFLTIAFFAYQGKQIIGTSKLRGGDLVSMKLLAKMIRKARLAAKITIAGLPLIKNSETQHLLLAGTTGSGKTNMLNELLPQIRIEKDRAIIFDLTGSFAERFFDPTVDILLNPFDETTEHWLPWNDCEEDFEFDSLAAAFIDGEGFSDKYWEEAAQKVLSTALQKQKDTKSLTALLDILAKSSLTEFCKHFEDTFAAGLVSKEAEKGTASVRSTLLNKIERLKYLKDGGKFSIKDWLKNGKGWLFITAPPNQRDTLRPLVSAWIDIAIKGLMDRKPDTVNQKMWFILDELPALQKIPSLKRGLAEGRKYGGCFVAGIQNIFQIEEIYGHAGGLSLLDMFNSRFFFKVGDQRTAEYVSKTLGEREILETQETLSYGANSMRDGVNINSVERVRPLVMPTEILNLPTRTCYVKLAENFPITKLNMQLQTHGLVLKTSYRLFKRMRFVD